jgi:hypothetical protein
MNRYRIGKIAENSSVLGKVDENCRILGRFCDA